MFYTLLARDLIEICIYSSSIFAFCKWLKSDKNQNILGYFLAYSALSIFAWNIQLPTITPCLLSYAPVALLFLIIVHEKTLQRNWVALRSIYPTQATSEDWLDIVISSCLHVINNNKTITIAIEHTQALNHFLHTSFIINADINKNFLDMLLTSPSYDDQKMVWISSGGKIKGINACWITNSPDHSESLFFTLQSDALILSAHPTKRTFSIVSAGKKIDDIAAHQARTIIKKQLSQATSHKHKGAFRESNSPEKSLPL